jgi:hypothetical protein
MNYTEEQIYTAMILAVKNGHSPVVAVYAERGYTVDMAICYFSFTGNADNVKILLDYESKRTEQRY